MSARLHLVRWAYAIWAALVATPIAWVFAGAHAGAPIKPGTFILIGGAFVAARAAAGCAAGDGTSSHGAAAATLTWLFYAGGLAAIVPITWIATVISNIINSKPLMPGIMSLPGTVPFALIFAIGASIIVLPACMIGTLLFNLPLFLINRVRRRQHSARAPQSSDCGGAAPPL